MNRVKWQRVGWWLSLTTMTLCCVRVDAQDSNELTLQRAEALLLSGNHEVVAARLAGRAAHADVMTAGEAPNPQFSFNSTGGDFKRGIGSGDPWDKRLDSVLRIDQPIERGNKRGLRIEAAAHAADAADWDIADVTRTAKQAVAESYYDLKYAQEATASYASVLELQHRSLDAAEVRLRAGDASAIDVSRLKIEAARAATDLLRAQQTERDAQIALATLLGMSDGSESLHAADAWPDVVSTDDRVGLQQAPQILDVMLRRRPDVLAAQARLSAAERNVELAKAQRTHDISIGVQYEHDLTQGPVVNSWGIGISVPLFVRHRYEGEIARATADRNGAAEQQQHATLQARHDIERAAADLSAAAGRLQNYRSDVLREAQAGAEAAEYAYTRGALSLTDLLDARRALLAVKLDALDAHDAYAKALAAWRAATEDSAANDAMAR